MHEEVSYLGIILKFDYYILDIFNSPEYLVNFQWVFKNICELIFTSCQMADLLKCSTISGSDNCILGCKW